MTAGAAARGLPRAQTLMSIGEVLGHLRADFPDVTISKLRFLEAEGLVEPHRAPSGYRKYSWEHVRRLTYILTAQRDRYLPLRVIRDQLDALDRGERIVGVALDAPPGQREPAARDRVVSRDAAPRDLGGDLRLDRAGLADRAGVSEDEIAGLEQYGLVAAGSDGLFDSESLAVARLAGLLGQYGLQPRHLRAYRAAADREVGLLAQIVAPLARHDDPHGRSQAQQTVHELATLCAQLHAALVRAGLRRGLGG